MKLGRTESGVDLCSLTGIPHAGLSVRAGERGRGVVDDAEGRLEGMCGPVGLGIVSVETITEWCITRGCERGGEKE